MDEGGRAAFGMTGRTINLLGFLVQELRPEDWNELVIADLTNRWIIVLTEELPTNDAHGIIAHEIAHAWLRHDRFADHPEDCETKAANLTREWGFTGKGADAVYCNASKSRRGDA